MRFKIFAFSMLLAVAAVFSCAKPDYYNRESPKGRSNQYFSQTDQQAELRQFGKMPTKNSNDVDSSVGCSLLRKKKSNTANKPFREECRAKQVKKFANGSSTQGGVTLLDRPENKCLVKLPLQPSK